MSLSIAIQPMSHRIPGRLQLALRGLEADPAWAGRLEQALRKLPGLYTVLTSPANGNLYLSYDPHRWDTEGLIAAIGRALGQPWHSEALRRVHPGSGLVIRELFTDGTLFDLSQIDSLPPSTRHVGWFQGEIDPLQHALRLGVLCHPGPQPDSLSDAFSEAAIRNHLPAHDWLQQYRVAGEALIDPFLICFRRRGRQVLALGRGEVEVVIERCRFVQDRQGCHPLSDTVRRQLIARSLDVQATALAYRPLLFEQKPQMLLNNWIFSCFFTAETITSQN